MLCSKSPRTQPFKTIHVLSPSLWGEVLGQTRRGPLLHGLPQAEVGAGPRSMVLSEGPTGQGPTPRLTGWSLAALKPLCVVGLGPRFLAAGACRVGLCLPAIHAFKCVGWEGASQIH